MSAESSSMARPVNCALPGTPLAAGVAGLDACVHCGFCLQACPTYVNLQDENDSPRGRLVLMRRMLEGDLALDDADVGVHIDRCLGCRACETACPSGVPYGHLLEATRATMADARAKPLVGRFILAIFASRFMLSLALVGARMLRGTGLPRLLARVLPSRLAFPFAMLASTAPPLHGNAYVPKSDRTRGRLVLLDGCVMRGLFAHTNAATARVLAHNGYEQVRAPGQGCCGALHAHAGDLEAARKLARANVEAFERSGAEFIAINAAGCGAMIKEYAHLLHDDPVWSDRAAAVAARARDISELLAAAGPLRGGALRARVTYDPPCHLMHAQRISHEPLAVLAAIPELDTVPLNDADQCCGSAGIYNLIEPETSDLVLAPKLQNIADTHAAYVVTGNPGCLMQIGAGLMLRGSATRAVHPVDLLDASYGMDAAASSPLS